MNTPLHIDFISDVACPWCAVGLAALDQALKQVAEELPVTLRFQPFELNPDMAPEGADAADYLRRKYGLSEAQLAQNQQNIRARGAELGFTFGTRSRVWNTFDAHRLLHWAGLVDGEAEAEAATDHQHRLKRALLQAYHGDGLSPSDPAVLLQAAAEAGLDEAAARELLAGDAYAEEVRQAEADWQQAGIRAVPSVVINGRHLVQGGQPPEVYVQALRQIAAAGQGG
jgi:predicted DsbA family dithiol-disulfide isomerase